MRKNNFTLKKVLLLFLIMNYLLLTLLQPVKVSANPAIALGVEAGVGAYVLAVLALSAGLEMTGVTNGSSAVKEHAYTVWDKTQAAISSAWKLSVQASSALSDSVSKSWIHSFGADLYDVLVPGAYADALDLRYDFLESVTATQIINEGKYIVATHTLPDYKALNSIDGKVLLVSNGYLAKLIDYYPDGKIVITKSSGGTVTLAPGTGKAYNFNQATVAIMGAVGLYEMLLSGSNTLVYRDPAAVLPAPGKALLPKIGADYKVRIPALNDFIPYPKTGAGTPDVAKGPLVVNPADSNTYKDTKTGTVYSPGDVAWDFPKPQVKVNTQTGAKEIGYTSTKTGTWEKSTDVTSEGGVDVPVNPPINWNDVPSDKINFGPLRIVGNLFTTKFPFSIPWDIERQFKVFDVTPKPAILKVDKVIPINLPKFQTTMHMKFDIDFTIMEPVAVVVRWFSIIAFDLGMILSMRKFMPE
jgi:hypothetical protein